jgi:hypothetical protein
MGSSTNHPRPVQAGAVPRDLGASVGETAHGCGASEVLEVVRLEDARHGGAANRCPVRMWVMPAGGYGVEAFTGVAWQT